MTSKVSNLTSELQGLAREAAVTSTPFTNTARDHLEKAYKAGQKSSSQEDVKEAEREAESAWKELKKAVNELKPPRWTKGVRRVNLVTSALWELAYWSGKAYGKENKQASIPRDTNKE